MLNAVYRIGTSTEVQASGSPKVITWEETQFSDFYVFWIVVACLAAALFIFKAVKKQK